MKTTILVLLCLCILAVTINGEKSHKHQGKHLKSGHKEHKKHLAAQPVNKDEAELKTHKPTNVPAGSGRKHRSKHHGKNKKDVITEGRSHKVETKPKKHNGQRFHGNKNHVVKQAQ